MTIRFLLSMAALAGLLLFGKCRPSEKTVLLITDKQMDQPVVLYGIEKLEAALLSKGYRVKRSQTLDKTNNQLRILAGLSTHAGIAKKRLEELRIPLPSGPEALVIEKDTSTLILCGSDAVGLMYALLETADRIGWKKDSEELFHPIENMAESPEVQDRAVSIYTMHRKSWEDRLYDEGYWKKYFDQLARNRINSFVVIFGYENGGFLAPVYPYFFDLEAFPDIKMVGITPEQQQKNITSFKRMIALAHERGIRFRPGIWDHIYRGGVQSGGVPGMREVPNEPVEGLVWGLHADNLADYTKAALIKFIEIFPEIDGIQFRMHWESGLTRDETPRFWGEVFNMLEKEKPGLSIDLRTKDLPDEVIQDAIAKKLNFRLTTKYWMEQMGLPFHPVHINTQNQHDRRHGYADLLTYPKHYNLHWRLWNGGTTRILLWGDPQYVARFVQSTKVYEGNSLEVNEPLATKMEAQPHDMEPFDLLNPAYQYYDYEFERYWYFFQLWGRIAYNPQVNPVLFEKEFEKRFGAKNGAYLRQGLHLASQVLPRIIAATYRYRFFPTTRGWAEKMRMEDLPQFALAEGSDIQLFANFAEEAEWIITGGESPKVRPLATARWFTTLSDSILTILDQVKPLKAEVVNKELISTITDIKILAYLSQYYGRRIPAAVYYNVYSQTKNVAALDLAIEWENKAIDSWKGIVKAAGDIYTDNLLMGICNGNMCGHWRDELDKLQAGIQHLQQVRDSILGDQNLSRLHIAHMPITSLPAGKGLTLPVRVFGPGEAIAVKCVIKQNSGVYERFDAQKTGDREYEASIPPDKISGIWEYFIEVETASGQTLTFPSEKGKKSITLKIKKESNPPRVSVQKISLIKPGKPLRIEVKAEDDSGVKWVQLRYRHLTQFEDYNTLLMNYDEKNEVYAAEIPGSFIHTKWDLMYFVEAMDIQGNGAMYPDFEQEMPYIIVSVEREEQH